MVICENLLDVVVLWCYLFFDLINIFFNVYRNGEKIVEVFYFIGIFYWDIYLGNEKVVYIVKLVINGVEIGKLNGNYILLVNVLLGYIDIFLDRLVEGVIFLG